VILALSLIGFTGSVAVAQLVAGREARRAFDDAGPDAGSDSGREGRR
jgi:hypothetical protein